MFLYSAGTQLAYNINKQFYNNIHYVWCSNVFDSPEQPPTSNPAGICRRFLEIIKTGDTHASEIKNNILGILTGANQKLSKEIITQTELEDIHDILLGVRYEDFYPLLYLINYEKVKNKCIEVPIEKKASAESIEIMIEELKEDEFEILPLKSCIGNTISIKDKWVNSKFIKEVRHEN